MGQWDDIKSSDIRKAINSSLQGNDNQLTHSDIVDIVRATLMDGIVTRSELKDLETVVWKSVTIENRSRRMLAKLISNVNSSSSTSPFAFSTGGQKVAAERLCNFLKRDGRSFFPNLDRDEVGIDIMMRVVRPGLISQSTTELCGPVAFLYNLASKTPLEYAQFAIDLYETGTATVGDITVNPGIDCRNYKPPSSFFHGDWLTAASLRDSENWFLDFDDVNKKFAARTSVEEFVSWFEKAGFAKVQSFTVNEDTRTEKVIDQINRYFKDEYIVVLLVNSYVMDQSRQHKSSTDFDHFAVLLSPISTTPATVNLTVYSWGMGEYRLPEGATPLPPPSFLKHVYGFVIAKPY